MSNGYKVIVGESCYGHYFGENTRATPLCPKCEKEMQYVGELTGSDWGNVVLLNGLDFYFGDMFLYYYYCDECHVVGVDSQCI